MNNCHKYAMFKAQLHYYMTIKIYSYYQLHCPLSIKKRKCITFIVRYKTGHVLEPNHKEVINGNTDMKINI